MPASLATFISLTSRSPRARTAMIFFSPVASAPTYTSVFAVFDGGTPRNAATSAIEVVPGVGTRVATADGETAGATCIVATSLLAEYLHPGQTTSASSPSG